MYNEKAAQEQQMPARGRKALSKIQEPAKLMITSLMLNIPKLIRTNNDKLKRDYSSKSCDL